MSKTDEENARDVLDMLAEKAGGKHVEASCYGLHVVDENGVDVMWLNMGLWNVPDALRRDFRDATKMEILNALLQSSRSDDVRGSPDSRFGNNVFMKQGTSLEELLVMKDLEKAV